MGGRRLGAGALTYPQPHSKVPADCMKHRFIAGQIAAIGISVFTAACTVETKIEIHDDASGRAEVAVILHPVAVAYMTDIAMSLGDADTQGPFDIETIRRSFLARPGIELESIEAVGDNALHLTVAFDDVRNLLQLPEEIAPRAPTTGPALGRVVTSSAGNPVSFISDTNGRKLRLQLTRSNFHRISGLFILPDSPVTVLLPYAETDFMPIDEYLEVLSYALEDYLGGVGVEEFMQQAGVYATVKADSPVTDAAGGEIVDGMAGFYIPLVEVLTLEDEIDYSVIWK
jgi:hypothetical protein